MVGVGPQKEEKNNGKMIKKNEVKFLYRGVVAKVQSPEALFSLGVVPVVSFAAPKSKE